MRTRPFLVVILILACSCSQERKTSVVSDDYALIEFAAKLEENEPSASHKPLDNIKKDISE
jgi:hypothetical protein